MRWLPLLSVVIGLSFAAGRLLAGETIPGHAAEPADAGPASLLHASGAAHFQLVLGRLQLDPVRYRKGVHTRQLALPGDQGMLTESLSVDAHLGIPTLHYCRQTLGHRLTLDVDRHGELQLESDRSSDGSRVVLRQPQGRPISIRRSVAEPGEAVQFATWIHLSIAADADYREHFEPLIDDLLYPLRISELAQRAQTRSIAELVHDDSIAMHAAQTIQSSPARIDDETLSQWIAALGAASLAQRVAASRRLYQQGISLLPRLAHIDRRSLDAEQRERLAEVIRQLTPRSEDHEARIAMLIRDDGSYWAAAAGRLSTQERSLVAARLQRLTTPLGEQVAAVPSAPDGPRHR